MKKNFLILILAGLLLYTPKIENNMGFLSFVSTWLLASYAYHAWCNWMEHKVDGQRSQDEVLRDLRECIKALRVKLQEEQREIERVAQDIALIKDKIKMPQSF